MTYWKKLLLDIKHYDICSYVMYINFKFSGIPLYVYIICICICIISYDIGIYKHAVLVVLNYYWNLHRNTSYYVTCPQIRTTHWTCRYIIDYRIKTILMKNKSNRLLLTARLILSEYPIEMLEPRSMTD